MDGEEKSGIKHLFSWRKKGRIDFWLLERQLEVHALSLSHATLASLAATAMTIWFIWDMAPMWAHYTVMVAAIISYTHRLFIHRHDVEHRRVAMLKSLSHVHINALLTGLYWGVLILIYGHFSSQSDLLYFGGLAAGVIFSGVLMFRTFKQAAFLYLFTLAFCISAGIVMIGFREAYTCIPALIAYLFTLYYYITEHDRTFRQYNVREREMSEQSDIIQMLLNEYEEQGSDWLWKIDAHGRLRDVNQRFSARLGLHNSNLNGTMLVDLFKPCSELRQLTLRLEAGRAFRNLTLPLVGEGKQRWLMLSARPIKDEDSEKVIFFRGVASDVTAAKEAEAHISYLAHYDSLTDLANRSLFNDMLAHAMRRSNKDNVVALLYLDVDHFKTVNDTLGHPIGDKLLQTVARRLENVARDSTVVGRLGGDEFAILVTENVNKTYLSTLADNIIKALNEPILVDGHKLIVGTSIGIAINSHGERDGDDLMQRADLALYAAKENGRNRSCYFQSGMVEAAQLRRQLEVDLRTALGRGELVLHYQPLVHIETGETISYEALVRWHHPERGIMMPDSFIPIAEDSGLIIQLGEWVLRSALHDAAQWPAHIRVSINLSSAQIGSDNLINTVVSALAASGVSPERLEMEITESVLLKKSDENLALLHRLRQVGVRISLDDFGTGYSSLNYLRTFPFDKIKIDRSFVKDVDQREDSRAIVRAVTDLARSLGMTTTAEGVERREQLQQLYVEGCTEAQGFLFSIPKPMSHFPELKVATLGQLAEAIETPAPLLPIISTDMPIMVEDHVRDGRKAV